LVAEKRNPHLMRQLAMQLPNGVILITGTNGKTTTTKIMVAMLEANGAG
jgi:UDP-N-acetylmuramoylalanine-D-glutamate ligase